MRVMDTFTGVGGFTQAYHKLGWETIGFSEIEPNPIAILKYHYPNIKNYGDITKIDAQALPDFEILIGGFPCFVEGTLIKTDNGYKEIQNIVEGDRVLTHNRRYRKVLNLQINNNTTELYKVVSDIGIIEGTAEHPVWTVYVQDGGVLSEPQFVNIKDLNLNHYVLKVTEGLTYAWSKINEIIKYDKKCTTYNLEVEEDNTYTANDIIVHNCQAFSLAGQRKGFEDHRGILWEELARILYVKKPKYFLFENVVGLINHNEGKSIEAILKGFCSCGYVIDWEVYNAMYYGVAQSRSRIIIWGIREDLFDKDNITGGIYGCSRGLEEEIDKQPGNQISLFTQRTKAELYGEIKRYTGRECGQEILSEREDNGEAIGFERQNGQKTVNVGFRDGITDNKKDIANCLHARDYKGIAKQQQMTCVEVGINYEQYDVSGKGHKSQQDRVYNVEGVMGTLAANRGDNKTLIDATGVASRGRGNGWKQKLEEREDEVSNCLTGVAKDSYVAVRMVRTDEAKQLRKENMKNGKDYTPFAMKQLETREDEIMNTLTCASNKDNLVMTTLTQATGNRAGSSREYMEHCRRVAEASNGKQIRRLTPTEAETLMGWDRKKQRIKVNLWLDQVKNYVSVVNKNLNVQKLVSHVERKSMMCFVKNVVKSFNQCHPKTENFVLNSVILNMKVLLDQINTCKIGLGENANNVKLGSHAENPKWGNFAQINVFTNIIQGNVIIGGKGELLKEEINSKCLIDGKNFEKMFGKEMMPLANIVDLEILGNTEGNLMYTILDHTPIRNIDMTLIILYYYAELVIHGYIPKKMLKENLSLEIDFEQGHTQYGINHKGEIFIISDSARYKACGNGVVSTMVYDICKVIDEFDKNICSKGIDNK